MKAAPTLEILLRRVGSQLAGSESHVNAKMLGLLFCRPQLKLAKNELLPSMNYFNERSAEFIDFFFVGFLPPEWIKHRGDSLYSYTVDGPRGEQWLFEEDNFNNWRQTIEEQSDWRYSGGNDLLLVNARRGSRNSEAEIDLSSALCVTLETVKDNERIPEISMLFEEIFRYAESPDPDNPVLSFSDHMGRKIGKNALKSLFISILPKALQMDAKAAFAYAVKNSK